VSFFFFFHETSGRHDVAVWVEEADTIPPNRPPSRRHAMIIKVSKKENQVERVEVNYFCFCLRRFS
jgi:hypothetical protein